MQVRAPLDTRLLRRTRRGRPGTGGRLPNAAQGRRSFSGDWSPGKFDFACCGGQDGNESCNQFAIKTEDGLKSQFANL